MGFIVCIDYSLSKLYVLMFLTSAPEEGGETTFTDSTWLNPEAAPKPEEQSACAKGHVAFKPKRGDAMLFWDVHVRNTLICALIKKLH